MNRARVHWNAIDDAKRRRHLFVSFPAQSLWLRITTDLRAMTQTLQKLDNRHHSAFSETALRGRADGGFKPLALRAVAAAARLCNPPSQRKPAFQDIPAVLREDAPSH